MKRLAGTDAVFLSAETPTWHQHVGGMVLLDASEAPGFTFEHMQGVLRERLPLSPKFAWKVKEVPGGFDRPVWVDDPDFHVENHFVRAACPRPGDERALGDMVGRIMSQQLDRRRPLWQAWFIEGLAHGRIAFVMKFHHAIADGMSGMALAEQLFDLSPDPPPRADIPEQTSAGDTPSDVELAARSLWPPGRTPIRITRYLTQQAQRLFSLARLEERLLTPFDAPKVSWNGKLGVRRKVAYGALPLDEVRRVKDHFGVKVNDVVIAVVAGTLRRYLLARDGLPEQPLIAGVPVSLRTADDTEMTNKVSAVFASMATDVDDPADRLREIHRSTQAAKTMSKAMQARRVQSIGEVAPPMLVTLASRTLWANSFETLVPAAVNTVISNVPGPDFPLYMAGAEVEGIFPIAPIMIGMGLNTTIISYKGRIDIGFHSDADLLEDTWELVEGLRPSLDELLAAIDD